MRGRLAIFIYKVRRKRTLVLKETPNNRKHLNKNKNYNEILEMPFVFNLQTVSTARRRCRSS